MKRGEIWSGAGNADYARKPRPWIIIQDDRFSDTDSILVAPITSEQNDMPLLRSPVGRSEQNGLRLESWVMLEKLISMRRSRLGKKIGSLNSADMLELERGLMTVLGLAR